MPSPIILIIDDEIAVRKAISSILIKEQMSVTCAGSSTEALTSLTHQTYDVILLDIIMPDQDGLSLLKVIRTMQIYTPVILLSGREEDETQVEGLSLGADDYMTKPFRKSILVSKIRAILRRTTQYATPSEVSTSILKKGIFTLHMDSQTLYKNNQEILLTSKEYALFHYFMENPEQTFTKQDLFYKVWKSETTDDNTILVYIKRLRNKIETVPSKPLHIRTVWGVGYQFFL